MTDVAGIIVAYHSEGLIVECVSAALAAGISPVVVWDNAPDKGSVHALAKAENEDLILLSDGTNAGFGATINKAFSYCADAKKILLINPDCFVTREVVNHLSGALDDPRIGIAAPRMTYEDGTQGIAGGPLPSITKEFLAKLRIDDILPVAVKRYFLKLLKSSENGASYHDTLITGDAIPVDWVSGFCMIISSELFRDIDGFDEDYFLYFEDVDICRRVTAAGYEVKLIRQVSALHLESRSMAEGKSAHYYQGFSTYLKKHGIPAQKVIARMLGLAR